MIALGLRVGGPRWRGPHAVKAFALARTLQSSKAVQGITC